MRISEYNFHGQAHNAGVASRKEAQVHILTPAKEADVSVGPLDVNDFATVVAATPLIAIDLIVRDSLGNALLGLRKNQPALGRWFVPGGRIYKNESLEQAFRRITHSELCIDMDRSRSRLLGVFEHFYDANFLGEPGMNTHYIVLAHVIEVEPRSVNPPNHQHSEYLWLSDADIERHPDIHPYAKAYFTGNK